MRILFVISDLNSGGAQKLITDIVILLNNYNCTCDVFVLKHEEGSIYYRMLVESGVNVITAKANKYWAVSNFFDIKKHKKNYDIIHSHMFQAQYLIALDKILSFKYKMRIITTEHSTKNRRRKKIYLPIEKLIYKQYEYVVAVSKGVENSLINWISSKNKIKVIKNGIEINKYTNCDIINTDLKYKNKIVICMVGRLTASKNQKVLIDLIRILPDKYVLSIIGDGDKRKELENHAKDLGIENRVVFPGYTQNVYYYLKKADIYIHASNWEGFGLSVIEAMSVGLPILASNIEGLRDIVQGIGILFENDNIDRLKEIVLSLEHDYKKLIELKTNSIKYARKYDINYTVNEYFKLYERIMKNIK